MAPLPCVAFVAVLLRTAVLFFRKKVVTWKYILKKQILKEVEIMKIKNIEITKKKIVISIPLSKKKLDFFVYFL